MDWLLHVLGIDTQQSYYYDFASGWGPKILEMTVFIGIWYWQHQCHYHGCFRVGRYPLHHHKLCRRHHPHAPHRVTHEYLRGLSGRTRR